MIFDAHYEDLGIHSSFRIRNFKFEASERDENTLISCKFMALTALFGNCLGVSDQFERRASNSSYHSIQFYLKLPCLDRGPLPNDAFNMLTLLTRLTRLSCFHAFLTQIGLT